MKKPEDIILRQVQAVIIHDGHGEQSWKPTFMTMFSLYTSNPRIRIIIVDVSPYKTFKTRWDEMVEKMKRLGYKKRKDSWTPITCIGDLKRMNICTPYVIVAHPDLLFLRDLSDEVKELDSSKAKAMCSEGFLMFKYNPDKDFIGETGTIIEHGKIIEKKNLTGFWRDEKITNETAFIHARFDHKGGHDGRSVEAKRAWVQKNIDEMMEEFDYINPLTEENVYNHTEEE